MVLFSCCWAQMISRSDWLFLFLTCSKEFAAFEEDQEKIFQELVPLNDIKPTLNDTELQQSVAVSAANATTVVQPQASAAPSCKVK